MIYANEMKNIFKIIFTGIFAYFFVVYFLQSSLAYTASSTSYRIDTDTISIGGLRATSTSYVEQSTLPSGISGTSTGVSYYGALGYLQTASSYISLSNSSSITLSSAINSSVGGQSTGSGSATVTTDNASGYTLSISASTNPAFQSSQDNFLDYVTVVAGTPDFSWNVGSGSTGFGFSPEGADTASLFKDNGSICGVGSGNVSDKCWYPLSTSLKTISQSSSANNPSGTVTTIKFMAEAGSSARKTVGSYSASITLTALAL